MKVSVLIPIYNVESVFARCLDAVFSQTYGDIDYVFVNDCTPDNSMAVLARKCEQYPHRAASVRIITNSTNQGIAQVRNTLLDNAQGDYVLFVDSDDWIEPDMVELLVGEAVAKNADVVGCDYYEDRPGGSAIVAQDYPREHTEAMKAMTLLKIKGVLWKLLVRRSVLVECQLRVARGIDFGEDYIFCCKLFYYARSFASVKKALYHYVQYDSNNYCSMDIDKRIDSFAKAIAEVERFYRQHGVYDSLEKELTIRKFLNKSQYVLDKKSRNIRKWCRLFPESNGTWRELNYSMGNRIRFFMAEMSARWLR